MDPLWVTFKQITDQRMYASRPVPPRLRLSCRPLTTARRVARVCTERRLGADVAHVCPAGGPLPVHGGPAHEEGGARPHLRVVRGAAAPPQPLGGGARLARPARAFRQRRQVSGAGEEGGGRASLRWRADSVLMEMILVCRCLLTLRHTMMTAVSTSVCHISYVTL